MSRRAAGASRASGARIVASGVLVIAIYAAWLAAFWLAKRDLGDGWLLAGALVAAALVVVHPRPVGTPLTSRIQTGAAVVVAGVGLFVAALVGIASPAGFLSVLRCWDWLDVVLVPLVLAALVADHAARGDVRFVVVTIAALAFGVVGIDHHGLMRPVEALLR